MEALVAERKQTLSNSFKTANRYVASLAFEPDFQARCAEIHLTSEDYDTPAYWDAVAEHATDHVASKSQVEYTFDDYATLVTACTPDAVLRMKTLRDNPHLTSEESRTHREMLSHYNSLLRGLVTHGDVTLSGLESQLQATIVSTIGDEFRGVTDLAAQEIHTRLTGVQHELGFMQILEAAELDFRPGNGVDDDLRGRDVIITLQTKSGSSHDVGIDVKSSLDQVDSKNGGNNGTPFAVKSNGDLIMYSTLRAADFKDTFSISPEAAERRAPIIRQIIAKKQLPR